ncbi:MAG: histidine phosphatase family protein [Chloroflexota bacterium]|nr:histidine phosphatase family protein [Chloroflexota bacterium]MDE2884915.1 histidine phosphatase family protein [Chloroflexota bacterium]
MLRLILARHGRTSWNVQGRVQGGGGLDEVGRAQVTALTGRLADEPITAVYASPAWRARQTAQPLADALGLPVRRRRLLRDLDYGRYAGALVADVMQEDPDLFHRWRTEPHTVTFDGGENLAALRGRIERFIREMSAGHPDGTVFAATHDSPVRMAVSIAHGLPDSSHREDWIKTTYASITELHVENGVVRAACHNDAAHLAGIE